MTSFFMNLVLIVQLASALIMIVLVLIQHGKGADMGASFGSGASGTLFGATGSANVLSRATAFCAAVFFICTLGMAYISSNPLRARTSDGSLLDAPTAASAPASAATSGAAAVPGAAVQPQPAASAASNP